MLVLKLKAGEWLKVGDSYIKLKEVMKSGSGRFVIHAPKEVKILRIQESEVTKEINKKPQ